MNAVVVVAGSKLNSSSNPAAQPGIGWNVSRTDPEAVRLRINVTFFVIHATLLEKPTLPFGSGPAGRAGIDCRDWCAAPCSGIAVVHKYISWAHCYLSVLRLINLNLNALSTNTVPDRAQSVLPS